MFFPAGRRPPGDSPPSPRRPDDESEFLDDAFPMGDGVAAAESMVHCPYCGEMSEITLDPGSGTSQDYIEDCPVCCQPWQVAVTYQADGSATVSVFPADGS